MEEKGKIRPNKHQHVNHQHTNNIMLNNQEKEATVGADIYIGAVIVLISLIGIEAHIYYYCKKQQLELADVGENSESDPNIYIFLSC